jgi:hypothetical protein
METDFSYFWPWAVNLGLREFLGVQVGSVKAPIKLGSFGITKIETRGSWIEDRKSRIVLHSY